MLFAPRHHNGWVAGGEETSCTQASRTGFSPNPKLVSRNRKNKQWLVLLAKAPYGRVRSELGRTLDTLQRYIRTCIPAPQYNRGLVSLNKPRTPETDLQNACP